jgi:NAD(P)-dependent dehydrogenase (short-subunit alcohol dehydrogenase family)
MPVLACGVTGPGSGLSAEPMSGVRSLNPASLAAYGAAKAGVQGLVRALAVEWAPRVAGTDPGCSLGCAHPPAAWPP